MYKNSTLTFKRILLLFHFFFGNNIIKYKKLFSENLKQIISLKSDNGLD